MAASISVDTVLGSLLPLDLSLTAKMIAVLEAAGVTATAEISRLIGRSVRRVQEARRELHNKVQKLSDKLSEAVASAENVHPSARKASTRNAENGRVGSENAESVHPKREKRLPSAENDHPAPANEPDVVYTRASAPAPARLETPSGLLTYEDSESNKIPPTPRNSGSVPQIASRTINKPITDWNQAFARPEDAEGVTFKAGKVTIDEPLRTEWLDRFGGEAKALDLALIAVARQVQPSSRAYSVRVQVESALARIAADRLDKDRRYAAAVARNAKSTTPEQDRERRKREMMRR